MTQNLTNGLLALGVVAAIAIGSFLLGFGSHAPQSAQQASLGGTGAYEGLPKQFGNGQQGGITIGDGTQLTQVLKGTANFIGMNTSQASTSTKPYDIAIPGIASGDLIVAQLGTTSPNGGQTNIGWFIRGCHASSTANYGTCDITNLTGAAAAPSVSAVGSSSPYVVIR